MTRAFYSIQEALMIHPTISTDQGKESQGEENEAEKKNIFEWKDIKTSPSPVVTKTTPPRLSTTTFSEADVTKDSSHQAKRRVRRRCLPGWFCPRPTKRRLRQKQAHHKRAHQRHHYNNL